MKIYIIRHGETDGNLRGVLQGWTDEPLNEKGRTLAEITAKALTNVSFDVAFSSPLSRAYETCKIILKYNVSHPEIIRDERLMEMNFGEWEGLGITKENFSIPSQNFNLFYTDPFNFQNSSSGESIYDVCRRTEEFYQELINNRKFQNSTILITTHGFALRCLLQQVYINKNDFWHGRIPDNCAVNIIDVDDGIGKLIGDDVIYYDQNLCVNPYQPV